MAGEWIKIETATAQKPEVMRMARILAIDKDAVVGKLIRLWAWFDTNSVDGVVDGVVSTDVDAICHQQGFCDALLSVGWISVDTSNHQLSIPNFQRHNGESAKKRALKNEAQAKWRKSRSSVDKSESTQETQSDLPEKRREEKNIEDKSSVASKMPTCRVQEIIDLYQKTLPELPAVRLQSESRLKAIQTFWRWVLTSTRSDGERRANDAGEALEWIAAYFERARENDFLMGRTRQQGQHAGWRCDLDFLLTEKGKKQVIEKTEVAA